MGPAHRALIGAGAISSLALLTVAPPVGGFAPSTTIWDGVYTEAQAARGARTYTDQCARCHGGSGLGSPHAGGVVGPTLDLKWADRPLASYFLLIRDQMPAGRPGSLTDRTNAAVVARLLQLHGAPPGDTDLPADPEALVEILIVPRPDTIQGSPSVRPAPEE